MSESRQKWILLIVALALMAGTAGALAWLKGHQRLGAPGVKAEAIPGGVQMRLRLPETVLDYASTNMPEPEVVSGYLPKDTSYAGRFYVATNGAWANATLILMGADRTSIHRPEYCFAGQGFHIRNKSVVNLPIAGAHPYELPVGLWFCSKTVPVGEGRQQDIGAIYVYWFVTDGQVTADFPTMLWSMLSNLARHGVLQRWAYVSYFTACPPGQEEAAFERMKALITASVPEFQLPPVPAK
jgi:hypothetical protein